MMNDALISFLCTLNVSEIERGPTLGGQEKSWAPKVSSQPQKNVCSKAIRRVFICFISVGCWGDGSASLGF